MSTSPLKVALVHEWLIDYSGSERVVEQILRCYPQAELYSVVDFLRDDERGFLGGRRARTSFIQRLPGARKGFRRYLPLMPLAVEQFDLSAYDLVISSSHAVSKGVITGPDQVHVSYVHTPMRYAWDLQHEYLREAGLARGLKSWFARAMLHYLRQWDVRTAHGVDGFIANSAYIARRIRKVYQREATVVYPPVAVERFALQTGKEDFFLAASRLVPYKRMPLIVEAFRRMPQRRLVMVGDGPDMARVRALAEGAPNIEVRGFRPNAELADLMGRARAFVFAAEEDFGITPVEVQACGTPVIAYGAGGAVETVLDDPDPGRRTGVLFDAQTVDALCAAVERFEALRVDGGFDPAVCRANAERFSTEAFGLRLRQAVEQAWLRAGQRPRAELSVAPSLPAVAL